MAFVVVSKLNKVSINCIYEITTGRQQLYEHLISYYISSPANNDNPM